MSDSALAMRRHHVAPPALHCTALHDCDIVTYSREMLARLLYPVANPHFHYDFCKGYYARVANHKLNGRVGRLLVFPLLKSLQKVYGNSDYTRRH